MKAEVRRQKAEGRNAEFEKPNVLNLFLLDFCLLPSDFCLSSQAVMTNTSRTPSASPVGATALA